jgi:hypothetical protein
MAVNDGGIPPILAQKHYAQPSAFTPENLLREARRQKRITDTSIPDICVLDPDGDIVRSLLARGEARLEPGWACSTPSAAARLISESSAAPSAPRSPC